jgi:crotonobetainyl-CoA:carnitine CoA-transferase CaiB-like acyl-CoA transferase
MSENRTTESMLSPYRALDLTGEEGLYCGKLLADLGADVIKMEQPGGDAARSLGPFYHNEPHPERSLFWWALNAGKRSITLNLETADGRDLFKRLVKKTDFVIESFPPGYLEKLGLDYTHLEKLNPGIILISITPFGQTGPYKDRPAADITAWAMGGQMAPCGEPDRPPYRISHHAQSYLLAGVDAAQGALTALFYRGRTGEGQQVDISIQESIVQTTEHITSGWDRRQRIQKRGEAAGFRQSQLWPCRDGYVSFAFSGAITGTDFNKALVDWLLGEGFLKKAPEIMNAPAGGKLAGGGREVPEEFVEATEKLFLAHTKAELLEEARKREIQLYPVATPADIMGNPQLEARDFWQEIEHPEMGITLKYPGAFVRASEASPRVQRRAPHIGEHNIEIYVGELGLSREEIIMVKQAGVI